MKEEEGDCSGGSASSHLKDLKRMAKQNRAAFDDFVHEYTCAFSGCGKALSKSAARRCGRCKFVVYCGKEHATRAWKEDGHKFKWRVGDPNV